MQPSKNTLDFIIIGAQKAGTTTLFEYLKRHPELCMPAGKEAPYFGHDDMIARGWEAYLRATFTFADPECKWGTATTHYMAGAAYDAAISPIGSDGPHSEWTV